MNKKMNQKVCIREIIDYITGRMPAEASLPENTVDRLEFGDPDTAVTGVVATFLATSEVIQKAKSLGANLIISHEGIFFSHWDKREMLKSDPVYLEKSRFIEESGIAIFRFHDIIHRYQPDGITNGLVKALDWLQYEQRRLDVASIVQLPEKTLGDIISYVKTCLGVGFVRFVGDLSMPCGRVGVIVGYRGGGEVAIPIFEAEQLDLIIYGEGVEWETPEYVRDAVWQGRSKALLVLGHAESEAPGMRYFAQELQQAFPDVPVHFVADKPIFEVV